MAVPDVVGRDASCRRLLFSPRSEPRLHPKSRRPLMHTQALTRTPFRCISASLIERRMRATSAWRWPAPVLSSALRRLGARLFVCIRGILRSAGSVVVVARVGLESPRSGGTCGVVFDIGRVGLFPKGGPSGGEARTGSCNALRSFRPSYLLASLSTPPCTVSQSEAAPPRSSLWLSLSAGLACFAATPKLNAVRDQDFERFQSVCSKGISYWELDTDPG